MPIIENGQDVLDDIYNLGSKSPKTKFMKWSIENANDNKLIIVCSKNKAKMKL